jgi:folate-binding protein YgfZ
MPIAALADRGLVRLGGPDRATFLQGLVSNDVTGPLPVWAALLTPQGKWLHDFFVLADGESLLLECEAARAEDLAVRLRRFRLRANVEIACQHGWHVFAGWGGAAMPAGASPDPRLAAAGWRLAAAEPITADADAADYDRHRLALGLPDGARDLDAEKSILLENGFDELHGVSWTKGCFMGQELTARTRYRGLVKKRLMPVRVAGPLPARDAPLMQAGAEVGTMRSGRDGRGLALLRLEALQRPEPITAGESRLTPEVPGWMVLPQPKAA